MVAGDAFDPSVELIFGDGLIGDNFDNALIGGAANDFVFGKLGDDFIDGGEGNDTAQFTEAKNRVDLRNAGLQVTGDGIDQLISIENVNGGAGNDKIKGNRFANILNGEDGNDKLTGLGGGDVLSGEGGNDKLFGGSGDDKIFGGNGKDKLKGDKGIDQLWGGEGRDIFEVTTGDGYDIIEDFTDRKDRIFLGAISSDVDLIVLGRDILIVQQLDALALVKNGAGKLQLEGEFLI